MRFMSSSIAPWDLAFASRRKSVPVASPGMRQRLSSTSAGRVAVLAILTVALVGFGASWAPAQVRPGAPSSGSGEFSKPARQQPPPQRDGKQTAEAKRLLQRQAEHLRQSIDDARWRAEEERERLADQAAALSVALEKATRLAEKEAKLRQRSIAEQKIKERARAALAAVKEAERRAALEVAQSAPPAPCGRNEGFRIDLAPKQGGFVAISIASPCRAGTAFSVAYGDYDFSGQLDNNGDGRFELDLFLGLAPAAVRFADGSNRPLQLPNINLNGLSKVALVWKGPVNLDLHALEYRAQPGSYGHVWGGQPLSFSEATQALATGGKGRGFMGSSMGDAGEGDKADVYTFVHAPEHKTGVVSLFVDFESRAQGNRSDTCGDGPYAALDFEIVRLLKGKKKRRERIAFAPLPCDADLGGASRYLRYGIRDLRVR